MSAGEGDRGGARDDASKPPESQEKAGASKPPESKEKAGTPKPPESKEKAGASKPPEPEAKAGASKPPDPKEKKAGASKPPDPKEKKASASKATEPKAKASASEPAPKKKAGASKPPAPKESRVGFGVPELPQVKRMERLHCAGKQVPSPMGGFVMALGLRREEDRTSTILFECKTSALRYELPMRVSTWRERRKVRIQAEEGLDPLCPRAELGPPLVRRGKDFYCPRCSIMFGRVP